MSIYTDELIKEINKVVNKKPTTENLPVQKGRRRQIKKSPSYKRFINYAIKYHNEYGNKDKKRSDVENQLDKFRSKSSSDIGIDNLNSYIYALELITNKRCRPNLGVENDSDIDKKTIDWKTTTTIWQELLDKIVENGKLPVTLEELNLKMRIKNYYLILLRM